MKIMKRYIQVIFICWLSINSITEVYGKDPIGISLVKWSFRTQTAILCDMAKENGAVAIDMVDPEKWDIVKEAQYPEIPSHLFRAKQNHSHKNLSQIVKHTSRHADRHNPKTARLF